MSKTTDKRELEEAKKETAETGKAGLNILTSLESMSRSAFLELQNDLTDVLTSFARKQSAYFELAREPYGEIPSADALIVKKAMILQGQQIEEARRVAEADAAAELELDVSEADAAELVVTEGLTLEDLANLDKSE